MNKRINRQQAIEHVKTLLILLLTVSALALAGGTGLLGSVLSRDADRAAGKDESTVDIVRQQQAARPLVIMLTTADNAHHGVKYNGEELNEVYSWFTAGFGEAMGSSGEPQEVQLSQWEDALHGPGVFADYLYEQSVASLSEWLGVEISSDLALHTARRFCLAIENDSVSLYYIRALDGKPYRCDTALNGSRLAERLSAYAPNGMQFAFEAGESYQDIDPYACILGELSPVPQLVASNPMQGTEGEELLRLFDMNPLVANHYPESDGTQVYVEGERSLRVSGDGRVVYSCIRDKSAAEPSVGTSTVVSSAYNLAMSMPGAENWTLQMSNISYDQDTQEYTVRFEYVVDGLVVCFGGRNGAMEIVIDSTGFLCRADFMCRSYAAQGTEEAMPEKQALAVITALGGGEPMLCYADNGETVTPSWVVKR